MEMVDKFFDKGGYQLLADFEEKYNCASMCSAPLFYLTKDVKEGPPTQDCLSAALTEIGSQTGPAAVCAITGILLLISVAGGFVLCSKTKDGMMDDEDA
jgi:hypothetical protein